MSNDMNNEQKLNKAYKEVNKETTSSDLDASIMAMAQQELDAREQTKTRKSWWDRLKMPVSITAALVVTVGIARFMVELGYYDSNSIAQDEHSPRAYEQSADIVLQEEALADNQPMVAASPEKKRLSAQREALEASKAEVESITVTGARLSEADVQRVRQRAEQDRRLATAKMAEMEKSQLAEQQRQTALTSAPTPKDDENQAVESSSVADAGSYDLVDTPYLPADEWLQQIKSSLQDGKVDATKKQWLKFKQVYPDYSVEELLYKRLESL